MKIEKTILEVSQNPFQGIANLVSAAVNRYSIDGGKVGAASKVDAFYQGVLEDRGGHNN